MPLLHYQKQQETFTWMDINQNHIDLSRKIILYVKYIYIFKIIFL